MKNCFKLIIIIACFSAVNVYACKGSDGCTNCPSAAQSSCMASQAFKDYKNNSCDSRCAGALKGSASAGEECLRVCNGEIDSNSSSSVNTGTTNGSIQGGSGQNDTAQNGTNTPGTTGISGSITQQDNTDLTCDTIFSENTAFGKIVHDLYNILKFAVPIILLAMSIKDFFLAITSQEGDKLKKAINSLFIRIIIAILILVLPTIINFILKLMGIETCTL